MHRATFASLYIHIAVVGGSLKKVPSACANVSWHLSSQVDWPLCGQPHLVE